MYFKTMKNNSDIRQQFPILQRTINGKPLIYFDNGATTQKPKQVIDCIVKYYSEQNANIHRGVHTLSREATILFEEARKEVATFIGADDSSIAFTQGTTDSINIVANGLNHLNLPKGAEVVVTEMEHHSNIVPWQILCEEKGCILKVIPLQKDGTILLEDAARLITSKTKLVSVVYVSNALGTINPIQELIALAHSKGAKIMIDAAQAIQHIPIDVQALDCDLLAFSAHKLYGPTGVGILYGKEDILNAMPPFEGGGDMIENVSFAKTTFNALPFKFEAGTPHISGCISMSVAIKYIQDLGLQKIMEYEHSLLEYATERLNAINGLTIYGTAKDKSSVISFLLEGIHPYDVGVLLDNQGIAIRTGHHCAQPVMEYFNIPGTCRASFALYNTKEEVDVLVEGILRAKKMLS